VKNVEFIMGIRSYLANTGEVPSTIRDALENTFLQGNPWGRFRDRRADWVKDLGVKIIGEASAETLLYVGCAPSYDPRVQSVSAALVKILQKADLDFGILGKPAVGMRFGGWGSRPFLRNWPRTIRISLENPGLKESSPFRLIVSTLSRMNIRTWTSLSNTTHR
jgi:hypothetical protein